MHLPCPDKETEPDAHPGLLEPGQLETSYKKPHHGHIVGEEHLLRTKDPFLNSANSEAYPQRRVVHSHPIQHTPVQTGQRHRQVAFSCSCEMNVFGPSMCGSTVSNSCRTSAIEISKSPHEVSLAIDEY